MHLQLFVLCSQYLLKLVQTVSLKLSKKSNILAREESPQHINARIWIRIRMKVMQIR
jgi:hypothetical protein